MRAGCSWIVLVVVGVGVAAAGPADVAFKKGRDLLKKQKWAEACEAFEESQRLDPQNGTRFNIAQCDEHIGKVATALAIYRDLAANDPKADRRRASAELADKLEPRVPRLRIQIEPDVAAPEIALNKAPLACAAPCDPAHGIPVDLGTYTVDVAAAGHEPGSATAVVGEEGRTVTVTVRLTPIAKQEAKQPPPAVVAKPVPASRRKLYGGIALGVGAVALGFGAYAGLDASSKWDDAKAVCGGSTTCASTADAEAANAIAAEARSSGNLATAFVAIGAVAVATGVVLWVTAPRRERAVHVGAVPSRDGMTVTLGGRF
ncbi:MAG: tetratricopeptide repeat protein [Deltaproteobacteria bacterium]|nr:tetratricopeptide repeat protein [Deltaproteobacteria bacterium]